MSTIIVERFHFYFILAFAWSGEISIAKKKVTKILTHPLCALSPQYGPF